MLGSCGGTCGRVGQPCCSNDRCTGGNARCLGGQCTECGGQGERCCIDFGTAQPIGCSPPYVPMVLNNTCFCN
jgi:hypothetical protein